MKKSEKFAIAIFALMGLLLVYSLYAGAVLDINDLFNGTVQTVLGGFVTMALTIWVYRFIYHRRSRK